MLTDFVTLRDAMDRLFEQSVIDPGRLLSAAGTPTNMAMPLEVMATPDELVVKALLPGVSPDGVDVGYHQGVLTLKAKTETPQAQEDWTWYVREIGYGEVTRSISLPVEIDVDRAQSTFENGILTLHLPKAEAARPKQIKVGSDGHVKQLQAASR
jgi:HSP20 family protein